MHALLDLILLTLLFLKTSNADENIDFCFQEEKEGMMLLYLKSKFVIVV